MQGLMIMERRKAKVGKEEEDEEVEAKKNF